MVGFSTFVQAEQIQIVSDLNRFITEALLSKSIAKKDYSWSNAGDGGYVTFLKPSLGSAPLDVAFAVFEKVRETALQHGSLRKPFQIRAALHAGTVEEGLDLAGSTNIWGVGINETARILSVAADSQLLVSREYHDLFAKHHQNSDHEFGEPFQRTVKHGITMHVMNASKRELGLPEGQARGQRWNRIGDLWGYAVRSYQDLIVDALACQDCIAAIAAACFLVKLGDNERVAQLCEQISNRGTAQGSRGAQHSIFSNLSPVALENAIRKMTPRITSPGDVICKEGERADSCFFVVSGQVVVRLPGADPIPIKVGNIVGEFSLLIPGLRRTATVVADQPGLLLELRHSDFAEVLAPNIDIANCIFHH